MDIVSIFKSTRRVSTPILGLSTPDPAAAMETLQAALKAENPVVHWDCVNGFRGKNAPGSAVINGKFTDEDKLVWTDPTEALKLALNPNKLPSGTVVFFQWLHRFMEDAPVLQALWNLRDSYKSTWRTAVLICLDFVVPAEIAGDVIWLEEALPSDEQLGIILDAQYKAVGISETCEDKETRRRAIEAIRGLPAFTAEQAIALSMTKEGVNLGQLWDMKKNSLRQVRGLQMLEPEMTYEDLGGLDQLKQMLRGLFRGVEPPSCVVFVDEIEKALSAAGAQGAGDNTGVSQDQLGVLLGAMEDEKWTGIILVGPPGSGKTAVATATGPTHEVPTLKLDLGATKGGIVGESEFRIRQAMRVIKGIAGKGAYFIATANKLEALPPELRRRFADGICFVDLPSPEELKPIWDINIRKYGLDPNQPIPNFADYTGADVRNICRGAYRRSCSLMEAAKFIVPVSVSDPQSIQKLRELANGKFLSASYEGEYRIDGPPQKDGDGRTYRFEEAAA